MSQTLPLYPSRELGPRPLPMARRVRGDALVPAQDAPATALELHRRARAVRSRAFLHALVVLLAKAQDLLHRALTSYLEYRIARETYRALRELDDRTLHDLGYDRSEIESVAVEVASLRARWPS